MNNLVILPLGSKSITNQWKNKKFDLWTFNFDDSNIKDLYADERFYIKNFKYHAVAEILKNQQLDYEYIWLPDDDLLITAEEVDTMFRIAKENDLILGQPSVNPEWHLTWHYYLRTNPLYQLRRTNYIEVMCPFFRKDFLYECVDVFTLNKSSYGIDVEWSFRTDPTRTAVIDAVSVRHIREVYSGKLYEKLKQDSVSATDEMLQIFQKFGIPRGIPDFLYIEGGSEF